MAPNQRGTMGCSIPTDSGYTSWTSCPREHRALGQGRESGTWKISTIRFHILIILDTETNGDPVRTRCGGVWQMAMPTWLRYKQRWTTRVGRVGRIAHRSNRTGLASIPTHLWPTLHLRSIATTNSTNNGVEHVAFKGLHN